MNFAIDSSHREFFFKQQFVEFEHLLNEGEVEQLSQALTSQLKNRLHKEGGSIREQFFSGRNLFLDENAIIRKFVLRRNFAEVVSSLLNVRPIRIAYDQYITTQDYPNKEEELTALFPKVISLRQMSCLDPIVCGLVLNLTKQCNLVSKESFSIRNDVKTLVPIPKTPGGGIFFSVDIPLAFTDIFSIPHQDLLMIVYGKEKLLYVKNDDDPHVNALKKHGYAFGDRMKNETHPLVYHP